MFGKQGREGGKQGGQSVGLFQQCLLAEGTYQATKQKELKTEERTKEEIFCVCACDRSGPGRGGGERKLETASRNPPQLCNRHQPARRFPETHASPHKHTPHHCLSFRGPLILETKLGRNLLQPNKSHVRAYLNDSWGGQKERDGERTPLRTYTLEREQDTDMGGWGGDWLVTTSWLPWYSQVAGSLRFAGRQLPWRWLKGHPRHPELM